MKPFHSQKKRYFVRWTKMQLLFAFITTWALTIRYKSSNKTSWRCILLSFINPNNFFHISINHFNNLILKTQMFNICTSIFSLWNTTKISLNFNSKKIFHMVLLCLNWSTRFPYFWFYFLFQIFNKHFTIQRTNGTLFEQHFWVIQVC